MKFGVVTWSIWTSQDNSASTSFEQHESVMQTNPDLLTVPVMMRRRLTLAGKLVMSTIIDCSKNGQWQDAVFCSEHGEQGRVTNILTSIAQKEGVSPTEFSLSVYNAIAGQYSIITKNTSPFNVIACDKWCLETGIIEAIGRISAGSKNVLLVYYEAGLADTYSSWQTEKEVFPFAIAMVICEFDKNKNNFELLMQAENCESEHSIEHYADVEKLLKGEINEISHAHEKRMVLWKRVGEQVDGI